MEDQSALIKEMEEKIQNMCKELSKYDVETIVISVDVKNKVSNSFGSEIGCEFLNLKKKLTKQFLNFILEYDDQHSVSKENKDKSHMTRIGIPSNHKEKTEKSIEDTDPEDDTFNVTGPDVSSKTDSILDKNQLNLLNPVSEETENIICQSIHNVNDTFKKIPQIQNKSFPSPPLQYSSLSQHGDILDQSYSPSQLQNILNVKHNKMSSEMNIRTEMNCNNTMESSETFVLQSSLPLEQNKFSQSCAPLKRNTSLSESCDANSEHFICGSTEGTDTVIIMAESFSHLKHLSSGSLLYLDETGFSSNTHGKMGDSKDYHGNVTINFVSDQENGALDHQGNSVEDDTPEKLCSQEINMQNSIVAANLGPQGQGQNLGQCPIVFSFHNQPESRSGNIQDILGNSHGRGLVNREITGLLSLQVLDTGQGQASQKDETILDTGKVHLPNVFEGPNISVNSENGDIGSEDAVKVQGQSFGIDSESSKAKGHGSFKTSIQFHSQSTGNGQIIKNVEAVKKRSFNKDTELVDVFGRQPYMCSICGVRFTKLKNLYNHKKKMHAPGVIKFRCEKCGTSYRSQESLNKHNLLHSVVEGTNTKIQCNVNGRVRNIQKGQDKSRGSHNVNIEKNGGMHDKSRDSQNDNDRPDEIKVKCKDVQNLDCSENDGEQNQPRGYQIIVGIEKTKRIQDKSRDNKNADNSEENSIDIGENKLDYNDNNSYDHDIFQSCDLDKSCNHRKEEFKQKSRTMIRNQSNHTKSVTNSKRKSKASNVVDNKMNSLDAESKVHICEICDSSFSWLKNLKEHLKKVHNLFFKCSDCTLTFASEELLSKHQADDCGNKGLKCNVCGKIFAKRYNMQRHMTMIHRNDAGFKCEKCDKEFKTKDGLKRHLTTHLKTYKCEECMQEFLIYTEMVQHKAAAHKREKLFLICSVCGKQFQSQQRLVVHLRTHSSEKPFECQICQKQYKSKESLKNHRLTHLRKKAHLCDVCGKDFMHKTSLVIHKKSHTSGRFMQCQYCKKVLASKEGLHSHMVAFHSSYVDFKNRTYHHCKECDKIFSDKQRYLKHKLIHSGEKPFKCDICGKCFNHPRNLKTHMTTHNKIKSYSCKDCGNTFAYKKDLLRHVKHNYCQVRREVSEADLTCNVKVALEYS